MLICLLGKRSVAFNRLLVEIDQKSADAIEFNTKFAEIIINSSVCYKLVK